MLRAAYNDEVKMGDEFPYDTCPMAGRGSGRCVNSKYLAPWVTDVLGLSSPVRVSPRPPFTAYAATLVSRSTINLNFVLPPIFSISPSLLTHASVRARHCPRRVGGPHNGVRGCIQFARRQSPGERCDAGSSMRVPSSTDMSMRQVCTGMWAGGRRGGSERAHIEGPY